jgi:hypothetical protein
MFTLILNLFLWVFFLVGVHYTGLLSSHSLQRISIVLIFFMYLLPPDVPLSPKYSKFLHLYVYKKCIDNIWEEDGSMS